MAIAFGQNAWIGFAEEVTYNTPVTPMTKWLEITDESIAAKQSWMSKPSLGRNSQRNKVKSRKAIDGSFKIQATFDGIERLFKHAMGTDNLTGPVNGAYTHAFALASALPVGLTVQVNRDSQNLGATTVWQYSGCQINQLTISQGIEDFLTINCSIIGADYTMVAFASPTFPTFTGIDWEQGVSAAILLNGSTFQPQSFELTIDNNLANDRYKLGTRIRKGLGRAGVRKITGKFVVELESLTEYNFFLALLATNIQFQWTGPGAGSTTYQLTLNCPNIVLNGDEPSTKDGGPYLYSATFEAYQSAAANDELTITLRNLVSAI